MRKYSVILLLFILICNNSTAQIGRYIDVVQKKFNWGVRAGFNATNPTAYQIYQDDTKINGEVINQVGFQCAFFGKTNLGVFFIQPDFSYYYTRGRYDLSIPAIYVNEETGVQQGAIQNISLNKSSHSLNAAVLLGYNVFKDNACLFNLLLGPNFVYNYANKYNANKNPFEDGNPHHKLNAVAGVSVNISHFYFDFRYELSIPQRNIDFSAIESAPDYLKNITIRKSESTLNFSFGMMF